LISAAAPHLPSVLVAGTMLLVVLVAPGVLDLAAASSSQQ
jgi:hypothetical protein